MKKILLVLVAIALVLGFGFIVARSGPLAPIKVTVSEVVETDLAPSLFGIGVVEARRSYPIGPTAAGRVLRLAVDVGDLVKAGEVLAEMDPVDLDERSAAATAAIARASSSITGSEAQRRDASARRELAGTNARRYVELGRKGFVSSSVVESKRQEELSAIAQVASAEAALAAARQDRDRLAAEQAALQRQRAKMRLLAPVDGLVIARDAEPGSTLVAGQSVVRLIDPASLWIKTRFDQSRSGGLVNALPASIVLRSQPARVLPGKVERVELLADSITEERIAQVTFDRPPENVSIGEMAEVNLQLPVIHHARAIPNAAIRHRGAGSGVWVLDEDRLRFVEVKFLASGRDGLVNIGEALPVGQRIVVYSDKSLAEDSRIRVVSSLLGSGK